ncbi:MAG TPA: hypothetical protein VFI59_07100 [Actinomycetota bacterium]|nr:hypothetical protein [Actinomycetota bacterium]
MATLDERTNATKGADMPDHDETAEPIPEADALEQAEPVGDTDEDVTPLDEVFDEVPDEAPEADALEQATPVPGQDEEDAPR